MRKRFKSLLAFFVSACIATTASAETLSAALQDYWNTLEQNANLSHPTIVNAQERGYVSLGSLYYRAPNTVIQPISFTPPSFSVGCNGIDFTFGSFSYLSEDQLVQFLQNMLQAAPAVFFEIALDKYLTSVKNVLNELNQAAATVNSMTVSSCQATRALAAKIKSLSESQVEATKQATVNDNSKSGNSEDFLSSMNQALTNFKSAWDDFFNTSAGKDFVNEISKQSGGFLYRMFEKKYGEKFHEKSPMAALQYELLSSLVGEVVFIMKNSPSSSNSTPEQMFDIKYIPPVINSAKDLIDASGSDSKFYYGIKKATDVNKNEFYFIDENATSPLADNLKTFCKSVVPASETSYCDAYPGFKGMVKAFVESIKQKFQTKQPLTTMEKNFVATCPLPILKWLKTLALYPSVSESFADAVSDYIAYYYVLSLLRDATSAVSPIPWTDMSTAQKNEVEKLYQTAVAKRRELENLLGKDKSVITTFTNLNKFVNEFEKATAIKLADAGIYGNL
ncbi:conjugal transfer protein TraH [Desulfurobacterium sp.]